MAKRSLLIPVRRCKESSGAYRVPEKIIIASCRTADALPLSQLAASLKALGVRSRTVFDTATPAGIRVGRSPKPAHAEGYRLTVTPDGVEILANTDAGAYYGVQTLRELLRCHGTKLPCCRIDDEPDFPRRAIYMDCARGKIPTVETVKALIERLASWKINEFQIYIENGFAYRCHPISRGESPFTPAEILEIQDHCKAHHIRFVASLASLGHQEQTLRQPAYRHLTEIAQGRNPGGTTLCPIDPGSIRLLRDEYTEFLPLTEANDFNACGDEPWELGKGRSKARCEKIGKGRVYVEFMKKVADISRDLGKRPNFWADIVLEHPELLKDWPKDIVMLNWDYNAKGKRIPRTHEIADAGLPLMVCPGTNGWGSHGSRWPAARDNVAKFVRVGRQCGAEGVLHTDWGDGGHRNTLGVSLCSYAHAGAHSWFGRGVDDAAFPKTFFFHALGQDDHTMARAFETLAGVTRTGLLYYNLTSTVRGDGIRRGRYFTRVSMGSGWNWFDHPTDGVDRIIEQSARLMEPSAWPAVPSGAFDAHTRADFLVAARQDYTTALRFMLGHRHRAGEKVTAADWRKLESALRQLRKQFDGAWLARNKPSRLAENQFLMDDAADECRALSKA